MGTGLAVKVGIIGAAVVADKVMVGITSSVQFIPSVGEGDIVSLTFEVGSAISVLPPKQEARRPAIRK